MTLTKEQIYQALFAAGQSLSEVKKAARDYTNWGKKGKAEEKAAKTHIKRQNDAIKYMEEAKLKNPLDLNNIANKTDELSKKAGRQFNPEFVQKLEQNKYNANNGGSSLSVREQNNANKNTINNAEGKTIANTTVTKQNGAVDNNTTTGIINPVNNKSKDKILNGMTNSDPYKNIGNYLENQKKVNETENKVKKKQNQELVDRTIKNVVEYQDKKNNGYDPYSNIKTALDRQEEAQKNVNNVKTEVNNKIKNGYDYDLVRREEEKKERENRNNDYGDLSDYGMRQPTGVNEELNRSGGTVGQSSTTNPNLQNGTTIGETNNESINTVTNAEKQTQEEVDNKEQNAKNRIAESVINTNKFGSGGGGNLKYDPYSEDTEPQKEQIKNNIESHTTVNNTETGEGGTTSTPNSPTNYVNSLNRQKTQSHEQHGEDYENELDRIKAENENKYNTIASEYDKKLEKQGYKLDDSGNYVNKKGEVITKYDREKAINENYEKQRINTDARSHSSYVDELGKLQKSVNDSRNNLSGFKEADIKDNIKAGDKQFRQAKNLYEKGHTGRLSLNPFRGYWGLGKTGAAAGMVLGALAQHKRAMDNWRVAAQQAAMMGLPPPPKPGMLGSLAWGAVKGGVTGAALGNLAKISVGRGIQKNMIANQKEAMLENPEYVGRMRAAEANYRNAQNVIDDASSGRTKSYIDYLGTTLTNGGKINQQDWDWIQKNRNALDDANIYREYPELSRVANRPINVPSDMHKQRYVAFSNQDMKDILLEQYNTSKYLQQCFSLYEELEYKTQSKMDDLVELYNAYISIGGEEEPPLKAFLEECIIYHDSFIPYLKQLVSNNMAKEYISMLEFSVEGMGLFDEDKKLLDEHRELYRLYKQLYGTMLDEGSFLYKLKQYPDFDRYIRAKLVMKIFYTNQPVQFAITSHGNTIASVEMPDNVNIASPIPGNNEVVMDNDTFNTQAQLKGKKDNKDQEINQAQQKQQNQAKVQEAEQKAKIKIEQERQKAQINKAKTVAKRNQKIEELSRDKNKLPNEVIAAKGKEITGLNLKEQAIMNKMNDKISQTNAKVEEKKQKLGVA